MTARLTRTVHIDFSPADLADAFCEMDDDEQAQFFVEVARAMGRWAPHARTMQTWYVGKHLATCDCATEAAREFVAELADAIREARP